MAQFLDLTGLGHFKDKNDALYAKQNDVDDLQKTLKRAETEIGMPLYMEAAGTTPANSSANTLIDGITLVKGHTYNIELTYASASDAVSYLYLTDAQINVLNSKTINAGTTSATIVYYAANNYDNAKLLINTASRTLDYTLSITETADSRIDKIENDKLDKSLYSNNATIVFASAATLIANNPVKNGAVYKITVIGENTVACNVRSGNGQTTIADIALGCYGGKTYYAKYTGTDALNLVVYATGACTVNVEELDVLSSENDRIFVTVNTASELLQCIEISHTVKMTIRIAAGNYDIIAALGASYFNNAPAENFGLVLCNDVVLIGEEGAVLTAYYTGDNANTMKYFSVFNAGQCVNPWNLAGGFELHNIKLHGAKIRYLIHDENNAYQNPYHNVYDSCEFYFNNSGNTEWSSQAIIGGGLGKHGFIEIKNCIFEAPTLESRAVVVSYHNSVATNAKSHIVMTGNIITPKYAAFRLGYHGTTAEKTTVLATNNKWGYAPILSAETADDVQENFELIEWNNVVIN